MMRPWLRIPTVICCCLLLSLTACGSSDDDEVTYVAIGASDATGIGASPLSNGYVFRIRDGLEAQGTPVDLINLGIPGAEADEIEDIEVPIATELTRSELISVFVGGNDIVSGRDVIAFEDNVREILQEVRSETGALIVVATLPDLTQLPKFQQEPDSDVTSQRVLDFNAAIRRQAADAGAALVELSAEPVESFLVSDDGFHPNDAGHQRIADTFLNVILPLLPPQP